MVYDNGAVEAVMNVASGELKKNGSLKPAEKFLQPIVDDPVIDESDPVASEAYLTTNQGEIVSCTS